MPSTAAQQPASPSHPAMQPGGEIDLVKILEILLERKLLIAASAVIGALVGFIYVSQATPIYRADMLIQVEQKRGGVEALGEMSGLLSSPSSTGTEIEVFKSRTVIGRAVDDLQLDVSVWPHHASLFDRIMSRFTKNQGEIKIGGLRLPPDLMGKPLVLKTGERGAWSLSFGEFQLLVGRVGEVAVDDTGDIQLLITDMDDAPGVEYKIVKRNRVGVIRSLQGRVSISEKGRFTNVMVARLEDPDPKRAAAVLQRIGELYVLQNVERKSEEAARSLEFLRSQIPRVKSELEAAEFELNTFRSQSGSLDIALETQSLLNQVVELEKEFSAMRLKESELARQFRSEHPVFISLNEKKTQMLADKARYEKQIDNLPETQQALLRMMRSVEVKTQLYTQLLTRAQELDVVRAGTVGNVRILDEAVSSGPVRPRKQLILMSSVAAGSVIGIAIALLLAALRRGVESPEQIENLGIPVYATVPFSTMQDSRAGVANAANLLALNNPEDLAVESLRGLRTSIHFAMVDAAQNRLMVTGPSPHVGKTFVTTNLGALLAAAGERVVIIDADMRRGTMHEYFGELAEGGLSEFLSGQMSIESVLRKTSVENLTYISRGKAPPNPSELLMGKNFTDLLVQLDGSFDMVLIDTPPALAVTDSAIVGAQVAATLLVARQRQNSLAEIEYTKSRLENAGVAVKGAVLNGVVRSTSRYGYGYDRYKYYQYDYNSAE